MTTTPSKTAHYLITKKDRREEETLYLRSISGMTASIKKGIKQPVSKCARDIDL